MSGYFGTEVQRQLQERTDRSAKWISSTPGVCHSGRCTGFDDPERVGWETVFAVLQRDGVCSFRMIPVEKIDDLSDRVTGRGFSIGFWDVFAADRNTALCAAKAVLGKGLPDGFVDRDMPTDPEGTLTRELQGLMAQNGVVPFSGSMLTGQLGPATTAVVGHETGAVAAVAFGHFAHNPHSPYHRHAFGGLVAVAEAYRGKGLGTYVNARMVQSVFEDLGADHILEFVSATNIPSRRMVEASGLRLDPTVKGGFATVTADRFTR